MLYNYFLGVSRSMNIRKNRVAAVAVGAVVLVGFSSMGAVAGTMITGAQIKDQTIRSNDIATGGVGTSEVRDASILTRDLSQATIDALKGATGAKGAKGHRRQGRQGRDRCPGPGKGDKGAKGEPGLANVVAGAGYTNTWAGDSGATLQTARGECAAGQYAIGGGFSTWGGDKDLGGDNKSIQVTVSAPYFEGAYVPVNAGGDFRPTEWVVKGYNNGDSRPDRAAVGRLRRRRRQLTR